jgi:hypothetical protein
MNSHLAARKIFDPMEAAMRIEPMSKGFAIHSEHLSSRPVNSAV